MVKIGIAVLPLLSLFVAEAQEADRKAFVLRGTVEQVDANTKRLSVANEPVPGGMGAMTMNYSVDKEEVFTR